MLPRPVDPIHRTAPNCSPRSVVFLEHVTSIIRLLFYHSCRLRHEPHRCLERPENRRERQAPTYSPSISRVLLSLSLPLFMFAFKGSRRISFGSDDDAIRHAGGGVPDVAAGLCTSWLANFGTIELKTLQGHAAVAPRQNAQLGVLWGRSKLSSTPHTAKFLSCISARATD